MRRTRTRGQALVELALVLPLLIVLLCATIEFGMYYLTLAFINNAVRTAARTGSTGADTTTIGTTALNCLPAYLKNNPTLTTQVRVFTQEEMGDASPGIPAVPTLADDNRANTNWIVVTTSVTYASFTSLIDLNKLAGISKVQDSCGLIIAR